MAIGKMTHFLDDFVPQLRDLLGKIENESMVTLFPFTPPKVYMCYAWEECEKRTSWIRTKFVPFFDTLGLQVILDERHNTTGNIYEFLNQITESPVIFVFGSQSLQKKRQAGKLYLDPLLNFVQSVKPEFNRGLGTLLIRRFQRVGAISATNDFIPEVDTKALITTAIESTKNPFLLEVKEIVVDYVTTLRETFENDPFVKLELDQLFIKMRSLNNVKPVLIPMLLEKSKSLPVELLSIPIRNFIGCPEPEEPAFVLEFFQVLQQIFVSERSSFLDPVNKTRVKDFLDAFVAKFKGATGAVDPATIEYEESTEAGRLAIKYGRRNFIFNGNNANVTVYHTEASETAMKYDTQQIGDITSKAIKSGSKDINLTFDMDNIMVSGNQGTYVFGLKQHDVKPSAR